MSRPGMVNAYAPGEAALSPRDEALIERRDRLLGPAYRLFYQEPVHFVRGEGVWLYDPDGAAYLDCYNNVASLGHSQPDVVAAVSRQWAALNTHTRYLHGAILDYAERLLATLPPALENVMFTCTGSEANDLAYRIARARTGRTGVIVTEWAYHGTTDATAQFSPSLGPASPRGPHVFTIAAPRSPAPGVDVGAVMATDIRAALAAMTTRGVGLAAFICDTIFSSDGVFADPTGFLAAPLAEVRGAGGLFVADEVQAGFARTGAAFWGFARHSVDPDLVTMGKPMGNGQPMGAVVVRPDVLDPFARQTRYFNTFGGNAVSCAAGLAVLDVIARDRLQENAATVGAYLASGLKRMAEQDPRIGEVRAAGLFFGVDLVSDRDPAKPSPDLALHVVNDLRRRRILISASGKSGNVLKIRPPLIFTRGHADMLLEGLAEALRATR